MAHEEVRKLRGGLSLYSRSKSERVEEDDPMLKREALQWWQMPRAVSQRRRQHLSPVAAAATGALLVGLARVVAGI